MRSTRVFRTTVANVLRMGPTTPTSPVPPDRSVMPQTDPLPVVQGYWASGCPELSVPDRFLSGLMAADVSRDLDPRLKRVDVRVKP